MKQYDVGSNKPDIPVSKTALWRYQVISCVLALEHGGMPRAKAVKQGSQMVYDQPSSPPKKASVRSIYRWLKAYESYGMAGLEPPKQPKRNSFSIASQPEVLFYVRDQKEKDPKVSLPEIIRRMRYLENFAGLGKIDRTTLWRQCKREGIEVKRRKQPKGKDSRRFAYPHRMDMILCDGKHFRAGITRAKRVALFFIDDATRFGLHVVVDTSENQDVFLRGLYECVQLWGLADAIYIDRGPGFKADDSHAVLSAMNCHLIHGRSAYPQGHGKIERFNQTAANALLRGLGRPDVDPTPRALELRLQHYLSEVYNHKPHASLNKKSPSKSFMADEKRLNMPRLGTLKKHFLIQEERRVSADHIIQFRSTSYEVPRGLMGLKISFYRNVLDESLWLPQGDNMIQLHPVDLNLNAHATRGEPQAYEIHPQGSPVKSAADMAFEEDFSPVVGSDGGLLRVPITGENNDNE